MKFFYFFLVFVASIFSFEGDPEFTVGGCVDAISGEYFACETDLVIKGAQPLPVSRVYLSGAGWTFFPHLQLEEIQKTGRRTENRGTIKKERPKKLFFRDELGTPISLRPTKKSSSSFILDLKNHRESLINTSRGVPSGQTSFKNIKAYFDKKEKSYVVRFGDGTKRFYRNVKVKNQQYYPRNLPNNRVARCRSYRLVREELPNGNRLQYFYTQANSLSKIVITDKSGKCRYGWLQIAKGGGKSVFTTSDQQEVTYYFEDGRLLRASSPNFPDEVIVERPNSITRLLVDNGPYSTAVSKFGRIKEVYSALSTAPQFSIDYQDRTKQTLVTDSLGNSTRYVWKWQNLPYKIVHPDGSETRHIYGMRGKVFGNLLATLTINPAGECIKAMSFIYDDNQNIASQTLWGNLSGNENEIIQLNSDELPTGESKDTTFFEYNGRNLPITIREPSGKVTRFTYLERTNLPSTKFVFDGEHLLSREFFVYDKHNNLIEKRVDDGSASYCMTTRYKLVEKGVALHLPEVIEELFWDPETNSNQLLTKTHLTYNDSCLVVAKEIFDNKENRSYTLSFEYDAHGNLVKETNPKGHEICYTFDALDRCTAKKEEATELTTTYKYDQAGQLLSESQENLTTTFVYDSQGQKVLSTDPYGLVTTFEYNSRGWCTKESNELSAIEATYDCLGNELTRTDPRGYVTKYTYNVRGQKSASFYPGGTTERFTYSPSGKLIESVDPSNRKVTFDYDCQGRLLKKELYSDKGELLAIETNTYSPFQKLSFTDQGGRQTTYTYDKAGRRIKEKFLDQEVDFTYDCFGRFLTKTQDERVTRYEYNVCDQIIAEYEEDFSGKVYSETRYAYDGHGNIAMISKDKSREVFEYDPLNRLTCHINSLGHRTTTEYEGLKKIIVDPEGIETVTTYDNNGYLLSKKIFSPDIEELHHEEYKRDPAGNLITFSSGTTIIDYTYDEMGRCISQTEGGEKTTQFTYNPDGKETLITKPDQTTIEKIYDAKGRHRETIANNLHYTFEYDSLDRCILATDQNDQATIRTFDPYGNLLSETLANGLTLSHTYKNNQRETTTLPDGRTINYSRDPYHLRAVTFNGHTHTYDTFNEHHNPTSETLIDDHGTQTRTYDPLNRERKRTNPYQNERHKKFDKTGNLLKRTLNNQNYSYEYNDLNQLIQEKNHTYTYDSLHNRQTKDDKPYTLNTLNQITATNDTEIAYDPNGNPIEKTQYDNTTQYKYDALDRLIQIKTATTKTTYTYDPWHRRLTQKQNKKEPEHFLYDGDNEIGLISNGKITQLRILGLGHGAEIGATLLIELSGKTYLPLHTLSGDINALIDSQKRPLENYTFTAFGEEQTTTIQNPWRYQSKRTDPTGLVFFGRRYYDPTLGRFLTPDPKGYSEGPHLYNYLVNNPLTHFDLYGLAIDRSGVIYPSASSRALTHTRNAAGGIAHGAVDLIGGLSKFPCVCMNVVYSTPGALVNMFTGEELLKDFRERNANIDLCFDTATEFLASYIPADADSKVYQYSRTGARVTGEAAMLAVGVGAAYKGYQVTRAGTAITTEYYTVAKSSRKFLKRSQKIPNIKKPGSVLSAKNKTALELDLRRVYRIEKKLSRWLGKETKLIRNRAKDPVFLSKDGSRRIRFDFNNPHGDKIHMHIEKKVGTKWLDATKQHRIYPIGE